VDLRGNLKAYDGRAPGISAKRERVRALWFLTGQILVGPDHKLSCPAGTIRNHDGGVATPVVSSAGGMNSSWRMSATDARAQSAPDSVAGDRVARRGRKGVPVNSSEALVDMEYPTDIGWLGPTVPFYWL